MSLYLEGKNVMWFGTAYGWIKFAFICHDFKSNVGSYLEFQPFIAPSE